MAKAHIFISYAHEDKEWVLEGPGNIHLIPRIRRHTSPDAETWFDEGLVIGEKWDEEIHNHIVQSHIAILLISESFVSSDYIVNKELVWIKEQVEKNDMKIVPLLIGNITEKSKRIIDWIYQRQIHPSETQPLCNYLNDKAQWDHMITSILNIIDAKIDQVLETLLLNESTRQTENSIKPSVMPDSKTVTGYIENRDTKITDKTTAAHPTGVNPALYQEAIRLYRNHKYKEAFGYPSEISRRKQHRSSKSPLRHSLQQSKRVSTMARNFRNIPTLRRKKSCLRSNYRRKSLLSGKTE